MIEFRNIYKKYGQNEIFRGLDLRVECGEFLCIIGSSGSGKTTLLRLINALEAPDSGEVFVQNERVSAKSKNELVKYRQKIGYCVQNDALFPHLSIKENILFVPKLLKFSPAKQREALNKVTEMLKIPADFLDRYPHELSGGQRGRVGIARGLCAGADIVLLDEPFASLDELSKRELQDELKAAHGRLGRTFVFVTHDIKEALKLATKILVLDGGQIHFYGSAQDIEGAESEFVRRLLGA